MRIIASYPDEERAKKLSYFLEKKGIENTLDADFDPETSSFTYHIWVHDEDQLSIACSYLQSFEKNPYKGAFSLPSSYSSQEKISPSEPSKISEKKSPPLKTQRRSFFPSYSNAEKRENQERLRPSYRYKLTAFLLGVCILFFLVNLFQMVQMTQGKKPIIAPISPIQSYMMYDEPLFEMQLIQILDKYSVKEDFSIEKLPPQARLELENLMSQPNFRGLYEIIVEKWKNPSSSLPPSSSMFIKIRQGQIWRLVTPIFLHGGIIHILFNMLWLWVLGKQMEERISRWKYLFLVIIVAVISNTSQYLMSGPNFVGFSGVVMGMVGFIWMRQKIAPWEGYPLQKAIFLFLGIYIGAMFLLQVFSFFTRTLGVLEFSANIANTAHIVGAITGALLGKFHFFSWRVFER
jgi:GlpG protein